MVRGERLLLFSQPLESYWEQHPPRPELEASSNGVLAGLHRDLVGLDASITIEKLFPGSGVRVRADWFTGTLRCPEGDLLDYLHGGFLSTYERELLIEIERDRVVSERVRENTLEPDPMRDAEREIERRVEEALKKRRGH